MDGWDIPGVGGVLPLETSLPAAPILELELVLLEYNFGVLVWTCCKRKFSNLTGDGMKPISQPSFTSRPIHQLLSYFSWKTPSCSNIR